jgi:dipeptidyl aminopeptidase/acylaminoacyl peptidase
MASGADLPVPDLPAGTVTALDVSADGRQIAVLLSTAARPYNIAMVDLVGGAVRWATDNRPVGADPVSFRDRALVHYPARDGTAIPANLYRPPASGRLGVVLNIHGGPSHQDRPSYDSAGFFQFLLSRGVAVLAPNVRGSTGYGMAYQTVLNRDWGGIDLSDLEDAVVWLREQDWVDPDRIGLMGVSYGGFAVLSCVSRLPQYNWAAAVSRCGPANLVTFTRSQPPSWRSKVAAMIGDPDTDEVFLASRSPITYVDQIRAPLLVIQGENDRRVPKHEADQIVERLRARGVEVSYDVYPDEGHAFGKRENQRKARGDSAEFLLDHLLA